MRLFVVLLVSLLTMAGCAKNEPVAETKKTSDVPVKEYSIKGEVTHLDAKDKIVTIKHIARAFSLRELFPFRIK